MESYRPLNNLNIVEKIIEEHLKIQLTHYLNINNIIIPNHHGSKRKHSTTTAITQIYTTLHQNWEKKFDNSNNNY